MSQNSRGRRITLFAFFLIFFFLNYFVFIWECTWECNCTQCHVRASTRGVCDDSVFHTCIVEITSRKFSLLHEWSKNKRLEIPKFIMCFTLRLLIIGRKRPEINDKGDVRWSRDRQSVISLLYNRDIVDRKNLLEAQSDACESES